MLLHGLLEHIVSNEKFTVVFDFLSLYGTFFFFPVMKIFSYSSDFEQFVYDVP